MTDNGELRSLQVQNWCSEHGILHLFTAPYTSAHNGRAERLHRTLMDKARAMRLACNAPPDMWDEFCATAAYLTNFTGTTANDGKTPYELWHGKLPSLSHLREIGCRAYALIPTHNPKVYHRSIPCILIGYAPNSKAYRLWDPTTNRIFDSFHVSFIEHRQSASLSSSTPTSPIPQDPKLSPPSLPSPPSTTASSSLPQNSPSTPFTIPTPPSTSSTSLTNPSTPQVSLSPSATALFPTIPTSPSSLPRSAPQNIIPNNVSDNSPTLASILPDASSSSSLSLHPVTLPTPNSLNLTTTLHSQQNTIDQNNNQNNTVLPQDTISPQDSITQQDTITPQDNVSPQENPTNPSPSTRIIINPPPSSPNPCPSPPSRIPVSTRPLPRRSPRLAALRSSDGDDISTANLATSPYLRDAHTSAFLAEFAPLSESHYLFPVDVIPPTLDSSVGEVLSAISTGSTDLTLDPDDDPLWAKAIASPEREYWVAGAREELKSLRDLAVFVLVPRIEVPRGQRPLKGKLVCKRKRDDEGNISRYKVRYVVKGFAQRYGIDYNKTTAPTARLESFRALLHIAAVLDWDIQHFDIKTAFLHGVLPDDETIFMDQPPGFEEPGKEDWVWRLTKSLYGMKQASRIWNLTFHRTMERIGFKRLVNEWCVYRRHTTTGTTIFAVHVDDIISISSSPDENELFKTELRSHWDISDLGSAKFALGISIVCDRPSHRIYLSQSALIDRIVDQFGQNEAHPVPTPMIHGMKIRRPDPTLPVTSDIVAWMDRTPYRSLIGSLNYLAVATRPDISFAVGRLATVLTCYRPEHWDAAIRVVRYLKGTRLFSLELGGTNPIRPLAFTDSDYANCPDTSRSVGGYCFTLGSGMVSWASHKQEHTADSSCYAEYIAIHNASHEVLFFRQFLDGLDMPVSDATKLYCDNDAARQLTEDQRWHAKIKHFRVRYHSSRELVDRDELKVLRVRSSENAADILTKPLGPTDFARLRHYLGIRSARIA